MVDPRTKEEHESKYVRINFDINNYQEAELSDTGSSEKKNSFRIFLKT